MSVSSAILVVGQIQAREGEKLKEEGTTCTVGPALSLKNATLGKHRDMAVIHCYTFQMRNIPWLLLHLGKSGHFWSRPGPHV